MRFGNIPILAEETTHVTASSAHAEYSCPRQEMVQRLFLYGVDLQRGGGPVAEIIKPAVVIHAYETKSALARMDMTVAGT